MVVVATDEEYEVAKKRFKHHKILKTGIGAVNVINKLRYIPRFVKIINFGFVGGRNIPIGTEVEIGAVKSYHPNINFDEACYHLGGDTLCYTVNDFVKTPINSNEKFVVDMELIYILALGFEKVKSIKIVSDSMNFQEYKNYIENYQKEE